jgi:hypothetical protein
MEGQGLTHRVAESLDHVVALIEGYRRRWRVEIFSDF